MKYTWANPEMEKVLRAEVEHMLLANPSTGILIHQCPKCHHNSVVNNSTPFGIDQVVAFMLTEFRAMEAKVAFVMTAVTDPAAFVAEAKRRANG